MTFHQEVHHHDKFTEGDYKEFESKLFDGSTSVKELESICMTLAHVPSKAAQDLLALFRESDRAPEVPFLDIAIGEGKFHYHSPNTEQEERDYLALKVIQELMDSNIDLQIEIDEETVLLEKLEIQHQAVRELVEKEELEEDEELGFHDLKSLHHNKIENLRHEIAVNEKICTQIGISIQTERYKEIDPLTMRNIHW